MLIALEAQEGRARPARRGRPCWAAIVLAAVTLATSLIMAPEAGGASQRYYIAIGGSETLGIQATGPDGSTRVTDQGYTDDLITMEKARWPGLQLVPFACPGLRVDMALSGRTTSPAGSFAAKTTSGRCRSSSGSEVERASTFITAHSGQVALVTVDLGYADVAACMTGHAVDSPCVTAALARVRSALPTVVASLRAAGGSSLEIVGLDHEDPYLGDYVGKHPEKSFAEASAGVTERYNQAVNAAYASSGVQVAQVGKAFDTGATTPAHLAGWGTVPLDVQRICTLTWMCINGNIHANAQGYRLIASAVATAIAR